MALNLDTNTAHDIKYKYFRITDILPDDIMQYIVSFTDSLDIKYINKAFNTGYNKNKALELKQIESIIDEQSFTPIVKYEEHHKTWIIHPTRTQLNSQEIEDGYKGPINLLKQLVGRVRSGDKLLFYDGNYVETEDGELDLVLAHNLQIIGVGNNVFIKGRQKHGQIEVRDNVYFRNIKVEFAGFWINDGALSMEDCIIMCRQPSSPLCSSQFDVWTGCFNAKHCVFYGNDDIQIHVPYGPYLLSVNSHIMINVIGCTFMHHKNTCIRFFDVEDEDHTEYEDVGSDYNFCGNICVEFVAVGNIFKDNLGYPIAIDKQAPLKVKQMLKPVVAHNMLEGYNGVNINDVVNTANKIYSSSAEYV
eukprot:23283_1